MSIWMTSCNQDIEPSKVMKLEQVISKGLTNKNGNTNIKQCVPNFGILISLYLAATGLCIMLAGLVVLSQANSKHYYWAPVGDPAYVRFLASDFHLLVGSAILCLGAFTLMGGLILSLLVPKQPLA